MKISYNKVLFLTLIFLLSTFNGLSDHKVDSLKVCLEGLEGEDRLQPLIKLAGLYHYQDLNLSIETSREALSIAREYNRRTEEAASYKHIAYGYHFQKQLDSAFLYYNRAVLIEEELKDYNEASDSYNNIGSIQLRWQDIKTAIISFFKALKFNQILNDKEGIATSYNNLGVAHKRQEEYDKAIKHYLNALGIFYELNDFKGVAAANNNIGIILVKINNNSAAIGRFKTALKYYKKAGENVGTAKALNNMGNAYENMEKYKEALIYYNKAYKLNLELNNRYGVAMTLNNIGLIYNNLEEYDKALEYYFRSLKIKEEMNDKKGITSILNNLAGTYIKMNNTSQAIKYLDKCIENSKEEKYKEILREAYKTYSEFYEKKGNFKKTLEYRELFYKQRDSLLIESNEKISEILINYELEKKNKEIELLQKDYKIQSLELEKNNLITIILIIIIVVIFIIGLIITYVTFKHFKLKNKHEAELIAHNEELQRVLGKLRTEVEKRKLAEDRLIKAKEDVTKAYLREKELNELKSRFVSLISHEYRTPLTVILSSAELIEINQEVNNNKEFDRHITKIKSSIEIMVDLLEDVLMIGRIESGNLDLNFEDIDMMDLCSKVINEIGDAYKNSHEIIVKTNFDELILNSDKKMLRYILINLLSNAVKYSPNAESVELEIEDSIDMVKFIVTDNGIGISLEDQKHIFDPFFRGRNVDKISGTGYGLSIVKGCVGTLSGSVQLESSNNLGSKFQILLPKNRK